MPQELLTQLPGATALGMVTEGATPFVLSRFNQHSRSKTMRVASLEYGPETKERIRESLEALHRAEAIEVVSGTLRAGTIAITSRGEHLTRLYGSLLKYAEAVTIEGDPAGSHHSWQLMKALSAAWQSGILIVLAGRALTTERVATTIHRDVDEVKTFLDSLSAHGLVSRVSGTTDWVLLKDAKKAAAPLAAAVIAELAFSATTLDAIRVGHVEIVSRLCIESLGFDRFTSRLEGSYAALCRLPTGLTAGSVAEFSGGEVYSIHPYREGERIDGGFSGSIDECLALVASGNCRAVTTIGPNHREGLIVAAAIAAALGHLSEMLRRR